MRHLIVHFIAGLDVFLGCSYAGLDVNLCSI